MTRVGGNTGLTWELRLALWLPGPPLMGAFLTPRLDGRRGPGGAVINSEWE